MDVRARVLAWDAALRRGDWGEARANLADDATWSMPNGEACDSPDSIVALLRSWKGTVPDVELRELEVSGDAAVATLHQPAWGPDATWFQVLEVRDDRIVRLADHESREAALADATPV